VELARRSNLATVTVAKLEEGRITDPKASTLAKLAAGLGCAVDDLVMAAR
jgi:transcriptional regulator with XRE-family HTH domain